MPVLLETRGAADAGAGFDRPTRTTAIEIGLLNNLSDAGLVSGERQFIGLLEAAAGDLVVHLKLYSLPAIARGAAMRARLGTLYSDLPTMLGSRLDGLIVTGCEPVAPRLSDEAYWPGLTAVIDWAEHHTISTLWSCLAAHAAVLHLDGIERRPLATKRSGVYAFKRARPHALLRGVGGASGVRVPHSRFNDLSEDDLAAHGYEILTRSASAGVDTFVKQWRSLFVYLQGHPEYDAGALAREYRRDVHRYLAGASEAYPTIPENTLLKPVETRLRAFEALARQDRRSETMAWFPLDRSPRGAAATKSPAEAWTPGLRATNRGVDAVALLRNWLSHIAASKR